MSILNRFQNAWNAFQGRDPTRTRHINYGPSSYINPSLKRYRSYTEKSILNAIYTRIAVDVSSIPIWHVRLDDDDRFKEIIDSDLHKCLNLEANLDQTGIEFVQDLVQSMFDEGVCAAVPILTDDDPDVNGNFKIYTMRIGRIVEWYPYHVKVDILNDKTGLHEDLICPKRNTAILTNPYYAIMNEPNSTAQRLRDRLNKLDAIDEHNSSDKLNMIIQFPYGSRSAMQEERAKARRAEIENQLVDNRYGIAYMDSTEKIIQLNRSIESNLLPEIEYYTKELLGQLGISENILNNTANEEELLNYRNGIVKVVLNTICKEFKRKFLTKTAITQKQSIEYYIDPFKYVSVTNMAESADKFTRNEIMTTNEFRQGIGMKPSKDPRADELRNKNLSMSNEEEKRIYNESDSSESKEEIQNE